ncbi:MAG TPA: ATPase domain-containing protein [Thermoplasmata archaeon]|nr:ATPase domain-containing protein [Thermoplasmata archaeon]
MAKQTAPAKPAPGTRAVTVPAPEDLELAKEDALLQLKIGRSAHLYAVIVSGALMLAGILVLAFDPTLPSLSAGTTGFAAFVQSYYLAILVLAGLGVSVLALVTKWEVYQLWPWEAHFSATVGAVVLNAVLAVVYFGRIAGLGGFANLALLPGFYPLALAGISAGFLGLALTWSGWGTRQWASAISSVLPVATAVLVFVHPPGTAQASTALAISLFLSAIFYQTSGSFLHLISSGTRAHERELITSGQSRMFRLADEVRQKDEALRFRAAALVKREADVENGELSIQRQTDSLKEAREQLDELEEDYRQRSDALAEKERGSAGRIAELDAKSRLIEDRTKAVELREAEVARQLPQISTREQRLVERESAQTKRDVELTQREQEVARKAKTGADVEARLEARRKELDQKTADLLRREGEITAREIAVKSGSAAPTAAASEIAAREVKLQQFKSVLDEQNLVLGRRARELTEKSAAAEALQKQATDREAAVAARETAIAQREADLADQLTTIDDRRQVYESAVKDYETRVSQIGREQVDAAEKGADVDRKLKSIADREAALTAREGRLRASESGLDRRSAEVTARERAVAENEAEIGLRRQELSRGSDLSFAGLAAVAAADRRDQPLGAGRNAGVRDLADPTGGSAAAAESLRAPVAQRFADRLPTGTPRLDDLLLGGLPPKAHAVVLGDPFVGKEVVVYAFLAEGLKRGEPVVIVTAARPPEEVAESLGVVLPQFREYEQMGMVTWIDASGGTPTAGPHRLVAKGSDDRAGILSNLVAAAKAASGDGTTAFRTAFLGLSAALAHGDERASFSFLQNVVGILKPRPALAMYALEGGALSEAQVETMLSRMDGAILFRQDRDKTFLSVKGFGEVATRDWIECRTTNRALIVGSFALERIR